MTFTAILTLFPMLFAMAGVGVSGQSSSVRRLIVEDQLIIRVPVKPPPQIEWVEHKGPKCISSGAIRGAFLSGSDHVDFVTAGRQIVRAKLEDDCPALDFYEGFYLNPEDERICAGRDSIRSRMGGSCQIERFRRLVPKERR